VNVVDRAFVVVDVERVTRYNIEEFPRGISLVLKGHAILEALWGMA
jgi:hypothetical protein